MACLRLGLKFTLTSRTVGEGASCQPLLNLYVNERSDLNTAFLHAGYGWQMLPLLFQLNKHREGRMHHTHIGEGKQPSVARRPLGNKALFQLKSRKTVCHRSTPTVNFPPCITLIHLMCHQEKHRRGTAPPLMANARLARSWVNLRQPR